MFTTVGDKHSAFASLWASHCVCVCVAIDNSYIVCRFRQRTLAATKHIYVLCACARCSVFVIRVVYACHWSVLRLHKTCPKDGPATRVFAHMYRCKSGSDDNERKYPFSNIWGVRSVWGWLHRIDIWSKWNHLIYFFKYGILPHFSGL